MSKRIFISYARCDGYAGAKEIIKLLDDNGHAAWQDLRELGPEASVWPQIAEALREAEFLIVLVTEAALESDYIRKEWREARRNGAVIMPVMATTRSRSTLPRWLRRGEVYDLQEPDHLEKFLARLNSSGGTFRADWDKGLEIETFIARPKLFKKIKAQVLSDTAEPVSLVSALQGRGGYGKSVLAGKIAHDSDVCDAYIDGVFWVDLGQDSPDVLGQINHLIKRISGAGGALDVNAAAEELTRLLDKRDVLIILDDVWRKQDLAPFAKATGHGRATLLATTRKLDALPQSAKLIDVSSMEPDEAVGLLSWGLAPNDEEARALAQFAAEFWHWPQLLAIANGLLRGRLRDGDALLSALQTIAEGARRGIVPGTDERERTISNVMQMGIDDLPEPERERFRALAVTPEDTAFPVAMFAPLWKLTQFEAEEFARQLLDRRLIQSRDLGDPAVGARIRMHDDMLWYLRATTDDGAMRDLHQALLAAHCPAGGNWVDLDRTRPALYYLWRHLLWHLESAGATETATSLRLDYRWLKAKLNLLGFDAVAADYRPTPGDPDAALLGNALDLSCHVLERDRGQLGLQLCGRLDRIGNDAFKSLCRAARDDTSLLKPVALHLDPPGVQLLRLAGHEGWVRSVAFSPDGRRVVSGGDDAALRLWDAAIGTPLGEPMRGHKGWVRSVALSPDGRRIVSGGDDGTLRLWDADTGSALGEPLLGHEDSVSSVAFSPNGSRIVSGGDDGTLRLWDADTGSALGEPMRGHEDWVLSVAFSPDGSRIISGGDDATLRLWDADTGSALGEPLRGHEDWVHSVAFSPDGRRIVSSSTDRTLRLWDADTGTPLGEPMRGHEGWVRSVAFSPDGRRIVSGSWDGKLRLWDAITGSIDATVYLDATITAVASCTTHVAIGDGQGNVHILRWRITE